ncbi:MAG: polysaccharide biosynthesis protein [Phycisphaeraceae bacterium]|nr:MAG: polysaccharide biosynthesis protein [Phycisphaeraceae bacterium]
MKTEIPLSSPDISDLERELVMQVLDSGRLSIGPMVERFEQMVAQRVGTRHAVAVSSGTAGLQVILAGLGIGPGDEVVTTPFSFIASSNVIVHAGATPVFVDVCPTSLNMDPKLVEAAITPRTRAILAVEALGSPTHMDALARLAAKHEIPLIEDSCEALGTTHRGRGCGSFGRAGVFGFYPNKQITTGEGGMVVTDDERLADACRSLRNQGRATDRAGTANNKVGAWLEHERFGFNFRLSELAAALGVAQMTRLDELIERRQHVASAYIARLSGIRELVLPTVDPDTFMSWFVFVVRLSTDYIGEERDRVIQGLRMHEVGSAAYFPCIHLQKPYREKYGFREGMFPVAESAGRRALALPFFAKLGEREVDLVAQTLELMIRREDISRG